MLVIAPVSLLELADKDPGLVMRGPAGVAMNLVILAPTVGSHWLYMRC